MNEYLKESELIGTTLFWSPLDRYNEMEKALRIEAELERTKHKYGASHLYYVHPMHSLSGLSIFFKDHPNKSCYLRDVQ